MNGILGQLGIDGSVFAQLSIGLVTFYIAKALYLDKLLSVLIHRDNKTTKLLQDSEYKMKLIEELSQRYNEKLELGEKKIFNSVEAKKLEFKKLKDSEVSVLEEELNSEYEVEKAKMAKDFQDQEKNLFESKERITQLLVDKFVG